jgi:hypothetical protein
VADETNYVIEIHSNNSFSSLIDSATLGANTTQYIASLGSGTYYARIKATNANGSSAWTICEDNPITL